MPTVTIATATTEELLEAVRVAMAAGLPASAAVDQVLENMTPEPPALERLVRYGLVSMANNYQHEARTTGRTWDGHGRFQPRSPHGRQEWEAALLRLHQGADGVMKPLYEFAPADCEHLQKVCRLQARGWAGRARVMQDAQRALAAHGAASIGVLPKAIRTELAQQVEEAWT